MLIFRAHLTYFMKHLLTAFFVVVLLLTSVGLPAQTGSGLRPDGEFDLLLYALLIAFACVVVGATLAGSMIASLVMLGLFGLVSAGVISAGVLVGLYRKSISAGFKTVVAITGCLSGILVGEIGFYLINRIFHLHLSGVAVVLVGGFSGLVGGLVLGFVLFMLIRVFLNYFRSKLSF